MFENPFLKSDLFELTSEGYIHRKLSPLFSVTIQMLIVKRKQFIQMSNISEYSSTVKLKIWLGSLFAYASKAASKQSMISSHRTNHFQNSFRSWLKFRNNKKGILLSFNLNKNNKNMDL